MIYNILLDAMVYNFTSFHSYFFLTNLKSISVKELFIAIIILFFLTTNLILPIYLVIMYIINKRIKLNINRFKNNLLLNLLNYFLFVLLFSLIFNKPLLNTILLSLPINFCFYLLSYMFLFRSINLNR